MQFGGRTTEIKRTIPIRAGLALQMGMPSCHLEAVCLELNIGPSMRHSNIQTHIRSGFTKWRRSEMKELADFKKHGEIALSACETKEESGLELGKREALNKRAGSCPEAAEVPASQDQGLELRSYKMDTTDLQPLGAKKDVDCAILSPTSFLEMQCIGDSTLVQFLRARKLHKEHFLDKVIINEDVYQRHPWNFIGGKERGFAYFCCKTKYSRRRNMRRDRMSREGGRWKQQGMVHPILNVSQQDAALKTYMSYIPCGKHNNSSSIEQGHFLPHAPSGRLKHRHRMIEIALEEDLKLEKLFFKFKVVPKPFLVVCVLKNA